MASAAARPSTNGDYTARHLQVLEGLEAVRKRPGMYIGSRDSKGLMHCLWEIIDNAVDEALAGAGNRIEVVLHADRSVEVLDQGRGIPVDTEPRTGLSGVEVVFTKLHAGRQVRRHLVCGDRWSARGRRLGRQRAVRPPRRRGRPGRQDLRHELPARRAGHLLRPRGREGPEATFTAYESKSALPVVGRAKRGVTGSRVRFWPDHEIFEPGAELDCEQLTARARQTSFLIPGLALVIRDERGLPGTPGADGVHEETFVHHGGITEFVDFLAPDSPVTQVWRLQGSGTFTENVPVLDPAGHMTMTELTRECLVDVALRWGTGLRREGALVRQHHRHAQGRHPRAGLRPGAGQGVPQAARAQRAAAQGRQRQGREGGHPRRPDRRRDGPAGRAAVRGPDQGGPRHLGGARHRRPGRRAGAHRPRSPTRPAGGKAGGGATSSRRSSPR